MCILPLFQLFPQASDFPPVQLEAISSLFSGSLLTFLFRSDVTQTQDGFADDYTGQKHVLFISGHLCILNFLTTY